MPIDHVSINRDYWNAYAPDWVASGESLWAAEMPRWGIWELPDSDLGILPSDMAGLETIELGCGTGYVSGWMARRGARATGIDISAEQLATARRLAARHGAEIAFLEGNAESVPRADASFDFAISEYGAAIWCDPDLWLREAWRLLRPGGHLVFLGSHPLAVLCTPENGAATDRQLHRSYRDLSMVDWSAAEIDPSGVEFNRSFAAWLDLFRRIGFTVEGYRELYAPDSAEGQNFSIPAEWGRDFPAEQVWWLVKPR